jgi:hypothetical protein
VQLSRQVSLGAPQVDQAFVLDDLDLIGWAAFTKHDQIGGIAARAGDEEAIMAKEVGRLANLLRTRIFLIAFTVAELAKRSRVQPYTREIVYCRQLKATIKANL